MSQAEVAARAKIAELYAATPPHVARERLANFKCEPGGPGPTGPHGPIGFYVCGMPGHAATPAEMYANHLGHCLYCLAAPWHFTESKQ